MKRLMVIMVVVAFATLVLSACNNMYVCPTYVQNDVEQSDNNDS